MHRILDAAPLWILMSCWNRSDEWLLAVLVIRWFGGRRHSCKAASKLVAAFVQHWVETSALPRISGKQGWPRADAVIEYPFASVHESGCGTFKSCRRGLGMSVCRGKTGSASSPTRMTPTGHYLHLPARLFDSSSGLHIH